MNFRGSTGYGRTCWEASFGQWGLAMQDDITDGVHCLIDQEIADPKRIAIYGGSYGGYATLAGITYTPDLYAAAVDYVGVSNLLTFMNTIPPYWKPMLTKMHSMVGNPETDRDRLVATSPALNADKRSEEHTSELQSLMRISYAVYCLNHKKLAHKKQTNKQT